LNYYLIHSIYNGLKQKAELWFLNENNDFIKWLDSSGHKPYLLSTELFGLSEFLEHPQIHFVDRQIISKYDAIHWSDKKLYKYIVQTPTDVYNEKTHSGLRTLLNDVWESNIRYTDCYLFDRFFTYCMPYILGNDVSMIGFEDQAFLPEKELFMTQWQTFFETPIPDLPRVAIDIEVQTEKNQVPNVVQAERPIIAMSIFSPAFKRILLLSEIKSEKAMIQQFLDLLYQFHVFLTFNGDEFDFQYIYNRGKKLGVDVSSIIPEIRKDVVKQISLSHGIHLDLFKFFNNSSFRTYAFNERYDTYPSLEELAKVFLNREKKGERAFLSQMSPQELAEYCMNDAEMTYELSKIVMPLVILLSRVTRLSPQDVCRVSISRFTLNLFRAEHRKLGYLIPRPKDFKEKFSNVSVPTSDSGALIKGATVLEPVEGIHDDVYSIDVASLYPTVIGLQNLSYESVCCGHDDCKLNLVPDHNSVYVCKKRVGIYSLLIDSLKDIRVHFKKILESSSPEEQEKLKPIIGSLKVVLVTSYGVLASASNEELFALPVGSAVPAYGRYYLLQSVKIAKRNGCEILLGDTDGICVKPPPNYSENFFVDLLKEIHDTLGIEMMLDKHYRFLVVHKKKNYLGVSDKGKLEIKGVIVKKHHTPPFIKKCFEEIKTILCQSKNSIDLIQAKSRIEEIVRGYIKKLRSNEIPLSDLAFSIRLSKSVDEGKGQVYKAARYAFEHNVPFTYGLPFKFVLTKGQHTAKPIQLVKPEEVDVETYLKHFESYVGEQILSHLDMSFAQIDVGKGLADYIQVG